MSASSPDPRRPSLEEAELGYRSLFEYNPDAVFELKLEPSPRLVSANPAAERISGYPLAELVKLTARALIAAEDFDRTIQDFARTVAGQSCTDEIAIVHKDGHRIDVSFTLIPVFKDGKVAGVYGVGKDISERRRTERERDELLVREHEARVRAVAAEERAAFLAEAG